MKGFRILIEKISLIKCTEYTLRCRQLAPTCLGRPVFKASCKNFKNYYYLLFISSPFWYILHHTFSYQVSSW